MWPKITKLAKPAKIGQKWPKIAKNSPKWQKLWKLAKKTKSGQNNRNCTKNGRNCPTKPKLDYSGQSLSASNGHEGRRKKGLQIEVGALRASRLLVFLAPQGALVVVVFLDISKPIQSNPIFRFECSQLFYVKLWGQVKPS